MIAIATGAGGAIDVQQTLCSGDRPLCVFSEEEGYRGAGAATGHQDHQPQCPSTIRGERVTLVTLLVLLYCCIEDVCTVHLRNGFTTEWWFRGGQLQHHCSVHKSTYRVYTLALHSVCLFAQGIIFHKPGIPGLCSTHFHFVPNTAYTDYTHVYIQKCTSKM